MSQTLTKEQEAELKDHYEHPKNFGKMLKYSAKGTCNNPDKRAKTTIFLDIDEDEVIKDIKFLIKGCRSTMLAGSLFTDTIKNHTLQDGVELANDLLRELESDLTPDKEKPRLVMRAYLAAVENYRDRQNGKDEDEKVMIIHSKE